MVCFVYGITPANGNTNVNNGGVIDSLQNEKKKIYARRAELTKEVQAQMERFKQLNEFEKNTHRGITISIELDNLAELDRELDNAQTRLDTEIELLKSAEQDSASIKKYQKMSTNELHREYMNAVKNNSPNKYIIKEEIDKRIAEFGNPYLAK